MKRDDTMSGSICPDCGMFDIDSYKDENEKEMNRCTFCGWKGDPLPRKMLSSQQLRSYRDEHRIMKERRDKGRLFFMRIYIDDLEKAEDDPDLYDDIMELLGIDTLDEPDRDPPYFFIKTKKETPVRILNKIKSSPRIKNISIY